MNKFVELPIVEPLYSTYHHQGSSSAIHTNSDSIKNWHLNEVMLLTCNRTFLKGYTSPQINIENSSLASNPFLEKLTCKMHYIKTSINYTIRHLLDDGYYVYFDHVDDYYVKGKTWYHERHFSHDGMICGYNSEDRTYCIYAYDSDWIYRKFWTSWYGFDKGRKAIQALGIKNAICGIKFNGMKVYFSPETALKNIAEYLDSNMKKYPEQGEGYVKGIVVHDYISKYIRKLYDGSIPYERMDRRVFRLIWEHKKVMLERIKLIEQSLNLDSSISERYAELVQSADFIRGLYACHHMKRRDALLPVIEKKLMSLKQKEQRLLRKLLNKAGVTTK